MAHGSDNQVINLIKELFDIEFLGEWGISRALLLGMIFVAEYLLLIHLIPGLFVFTLAWLIGTAPIWLPVALLLGFCNSWVWYIQSLYLSGRNPVLLEMKMPREISKSPRAMELAYTAFSLSSGETTFLHRVWKGQVRPIFSFEIASFGGELHFYVWCWKNYRGTVESAIYAQYPEVEFHEVEDYASKFQFVPGKHNAWGVEWPLMSYIPGLNWKFEINAYPIRTYVDFELDKDPKEEFKIDPFAQVLEFMGSIKPHEQLWVQIVMRKCGKRNVLNFFNAPDEDTLWKKMVEKEVEKIRTRAAVISSTAISEVFEELGEDEDVKRQPQPRATWRQTRQMESMERNLGKYPFEVGMRGIYWTEKDLHGPTYTGFRWMWRPFGNPQYATHLRPKRWHCDFDYPWQDFKDIRWNNQTRRVHDAFRRRSFFHTPWIIPTNILTNEVLASIWRPVSSTISAPGLSRIPSTKSSPPPNLPK